MACSTCWCCDRCKCRGRHWPFPQLPFDSEPHTWSNPSLVAIQARPWISASGAALVARSGSRAAARSSGTTARAAAVAAADIGAAPLAARRRGRDRAWPAPRPRLSSFSFEFSNVVAGSPHRGRPVRRRGSRDQKTSERLNQPSAPEPAPAIEASGSPEATMAMATRIMKAVLRR
jgi:pyruvate/2-oxoglutarate dehydrogenase complex dihydrolipoamide acyltransferase (E2) component